jgi:hypothetical protein
VFDTQEGIVPQEAIEPETQGMGREFGQEARGEAPEGMRMVGLDMQLLDSLTVDGFDALTNLVMQMPLRRWELSLVATRHGEQRHSIFCL